MWSGASCRDQFVADVPWERKVGNCAMEVPKFAKAEPELNSTHTVFSNAHTFPR